MWVETVTEGGRRFMVAWRKEEVGAARHRQEKREATGLEKLLSHTEEQNFAKRYPLASSTSLRNPCTGARRIETYVAPRHVDASHDFYLFSPNEQRGERGGRGAARLFILLYFPCSEDHEQDWPPCSVVFGGRQPIR